MKSGYIVINPIKLEKKDRFLYLTNFEYLNEVIHYPNRKYLGKYHLNNSIGVWKIKNKKS